MNPSSRLTKEQEKERYLQHNNDVNDPRYQKFVKPVVDHILEFFTKEKKGLDFGCGTGPVISKMLSDSGYTTSLYDPFFYPGNSALKDTYDYIICCEVAEHFTNPSAEFALLHSLLNTDGQLICMTELFTDTVDFEKWHYNNDPTHYIFYQKETLAYIQKAVGFKSFKTDGRLIVFYK
ncbi:MAG TPA: class I SAM-dependent methyltransferase [Spirochaetota bacterium]|nr:class I SAM-dependent methyltransferase [Spirochaetota bacterium]